MTPGMPAVSVVTVNFNAGEALLACVRSVLSSSVAAHVYVVDNASTDGSIQRLMAECAGDERVIVHQNAANVGFARATNQALRQIESDSILLLNPDCEVEPCTLATMSEVMKSHPEVGMAGCLVLNSDGTEQEGCRRMIPTPGRAFARAFGFERMAQRVRTWLGHPGRSGVVLTGEPLPAQPAGVEAISGAFMFVRRDAMASVGLLDEGFFLHCEDLDWCVRFRAAGHVVLFVPSARTVHHKGRCSRTNPLAVQWHLHRGMVRFHWKHFRHRYSFVVTALVIVGVWSRFLAVTVATAWSEARRFISDRQG